MTDIRVTREAVEILSEVTTIPEVRITREAIEVLTSKESTPPTPEEGVRRFINITYIVGS